MVDLVPLQVCGAQGEAPHYDNRRTTMLKTMLLIGAAVVSFPALAQTQPADPMTPPTSQPSEPAPENTQPTPPTPAAEPAPAPDAAAQPTPAPTQIGRAHV